MNFLKVQSNWRRNQNTRGILPQLPKNDGSKANAAQCLEHWRVEEWQCLRCISRDIGAHAVINELPPHAESVLNSVSLETTYTPFPLCSGASSSVQEKYVTSLVPKDQEPLGNSLGNITCMYVYSLSRAWLCDLMDCSSPDSIVYRILQARTLEWVAISFSNSWKWKVKVKLLSRVQLLATPWTAAYQAPLSMGFSRQEYWSGVPLPFPETLLSFSNYSKRQTVLLQV